MNEPNEGRKTRFFLLILSGINCKRHHLLKGNRCQQNKTKRKKKPRVTLDTRPFETEKKNPVTMTRRKANGTQFNRKRRDAHERVEYADLSLLFYCFFSNISLSSFSHRDYDSRMQARSMKSRKRKRDREKN